MRKTRPLSVRFNVLICIHGLAPHYLSNDVTMHVDIHGYDTRSAEYGFIYTPRCTKGIYKIIILYKGSSLWNKLPPWVKESAFLNDFKHNFRLLNGWIHPEFIFFFICMPISYPILMLLFYQFCLHLVGCIHIRILTQSYHDIVVFNVWFIFMAESGIRNHLFEEIYNTVNLQKHTYSFIVHIAVFFLDVGKSLFRRDPHQLI